MGLYDDNDVCNAKSRKSIEFTNVFMAGYEALVESGALLREGRNDEAAARAGEGRREIDSDASGVKSDNMIFSIRQMLAEIENRLFVPQNEILCMAINSMAVLGGTGVISKDTATVFIHKAVPAVFHRKGAL